MKKNQQTILRRKIYIDLASVTPTGASTDTFDNSNFAPSDSQILNNLIGEKWIHEYKINSMKAIYLPERPYHATRQGYVLMYQQAESTDTPPASATDCIELGLSHRNAKLFPSGKRAEIPLTLEQTERGWQDRANAATTIAEVVYCIIRHDHGANAVGRIIIELDASFR